jgi:hypothetical protein
MADHYRQAVHLWATLGRACVPHDETLGDQE